MNLRDLHKIFYTLNYIDYYNNQRLQRKLHVMTPMKYHEQYTKAA
ncbi:MAG: IS3 family transposase [Dorea longicatena]